MLWLYLVGYMTADDKIDIVISIFIMEESTSA